MAVAWIHFHYEGWFNVLAARGQGYTKRAIREALKEANKTAVVWWKDRFIPKHFEHAARWRYHYQQRKRKYRKIKERLAAGEIVYVRGQRLQEEVQKGGRVDVVRGGRTEEMAERSAPIRTTPSAAKCFVPVPRYIVMKRAAFPNLKSELERLTRAERKLLADLWKKALLSALKRFGSAGRLTKRIGA